MPFFSTIIPCYNRAGLIGKTLDSVFAQEYADQEVILVDDGSTDATLDVAARYAARVKVLGQSHKGPGAARNLGLQEARGDYVAFLDSDDFWFPWTLATYAQVIREQKSPAFVAAAAQWFTEEQELQAVRRSAPRVESFQDFLSTARRPIFFGMSWFVVRRDILRQVGGLTDHWINAEDAELRLRLGTAPGFCLVHEPITLGYRVHPGSAIGNVERTFQGIRYLIQQEKGRLYPGGPARRRERQAIITRHARSASVDCLRARGARQGWTLYRETLAWNLALLRFRYLLAFPVLSLAAWCRRTAGPRPEPATTQGP